MSEAAEQIERIQTKIQQLLKEQHSLQQLNHDLKRKMHELKKESQEQLETIDELQQQLAVLKAAKSELSEDEKKAFEKRLGQYIKEIDRCITILSE
jgi:chromosome segregation ATPase